MCGRITNEFNLDRMLRELGAAAEPGLTWEASYNVAPTQLLPIVGVRDCERVLRTVRWGLVPSWAKDPSGAARAINARAETVHEKASFRVAFGRRRCLVVVSGWYEWRLVGKAKQPYWFHAPKGELLTLAGIWEAWHLGQPDELRTCAVITTEPNAIAGQIHDRAPALLGPDDAARWLAPETPADELRAMLQPFDERMIEAWPVDKRVGSPKNNDPSLIERVGRAEHAA